MGEQRTPEICDEVLRVEETGQPIIRHRYHVYVVCLLLSVHVLGKPGQPPRPSLLPPRLRPM